MDVPEIPSRSMADVEIGERAKILRVGGGAELHRRLMDMGLVRGTEILMIRNAPLRDPVEIEVKGYRLAIRRSEASQVRVEAPAASGEPDAEQG
jgi:Fe2+ transport system protein FeoA